MWLILNYIYRQSSVKLESVTFPHISFTWLELSMLSWRYLNNNTKFRESKAHWDQFYKQVTKFRVKQFFNSKEHSGVTHNKK